MTDAGSRGPLLMVAHGLPPRETGGVELYTLALAKRLKRERPVALFAHRTAPVQGPCHEDREEDGIPVREALSDLTWIRRLEDLYLNRRWEASFDDWMDRIRPETVHFHHAIRLSPLLVERALEHGVKVGVTLHDFFTVCPRVHRFRPDGTPCYGHRFRLDCLKCLQGAHWPAPWGLAGWRELQRVFLRMKRILHRVHYLEAPSRFVADVFRRFGVRRAIEVKPLGLIHSPVAGGSPGEGGTVEKPARPAGTVTFGYIGGYMAYKGVELLLEAFAELRGRRDDVRLRLYGVDRDKAYVNDLKARFSGGPFIHWGGEFPPERLPAVLDTMDVLVTPSICEETYSFAAREGTARGMPVVGADAGALAEALQGCPGCRLFPRGDLGGLVRAMESLLPPSP